MPVLVAFSGLPGVGKTTVARLLAGQVRAAYLRIDAIEQAMKATGVEHVGPAGYAVANALAEANLRLGLSVVADCVNPVRDSRLGWSGVAARAGVKLVNIHLACSDAKEHRRRVEGRTADLPGLVLPSWAAVEQRLFEPRDDDHAVLDTAGTTPEALAAQCLALVQQA